MSKYECSSFCSFYKGEKFIEGYIKNMLEQTIFNDVEFIFVNCDSPENEEQYILPLLDKYKNIKYIKLDKDPGLYAAWNIAIKNSSTDIITNWNVDDRKPADGLEKLLTVMQYDNTIDMVYGSVVMSTIPNETYEENDKKEWFKIYPPTFGTYLTHNSPHCMPMWRKRIHDTCGYFSENYDCVSDAEMWLKLLINKGNIKLVNTPVGLYYFNPTGRSSDESRLQANYKEACIMKDNMIKSLGKKKLGIDDLFHWYKNSHFEIYKKYVSEGIEFAKDKKIIVAGLCRSAEEYLSDNINYIEYYISKLAKDYKIVLFENDSEDNTKQILKNLNQNNSKIISLSQDFNRPKFGTVKTKERIQALAEYRTILQKYIKDNYSDYDYVILLDTDFLDLSFSGILNSFGWISKNNIIDAMAGFSYSFKNFHGLYHIWNYDSWAYREDWWEDLENYPDYPEIQQYPAMTWFGYKVHRRGSKPIKVNSAFGGTCIYKMSDYLLGEYSFEDCEHVIFHKSILDKNKNFKLYANPSQMMLVYEKTY